MTRCRECHAVMTKDEPACVGCGSVALPKNAKTSMVNTIRVSIKVLLFMSGIITIASIFFDVTPKFSKCLVTTVVLGLVKSSADQMIERDNS